MKRRISLRNRLTAYGPEIALDALEERIVLDASPDQTDTASVNTPAPEVAPSPATGSAASPPPATGAPVPHDGLQVIIVSDSVEHINEIQNAAADAQVIIYNHHTDNTADIAKKLNDLAVNTGREIETLTVVDHGAAGLIEMGTDSVSLAGWFKYAEAFTQIGSHLAQNAQIQFFGCSIAASGEGKLLVDRIAQVTGADVFASVDDTGGPLGNWRLEYSSAQGTEAIPVLNAESLGAAASLIFPGFPPVDDFSTSYVYYSVLDNLDPSNLVAPMEITRYGEVWQFTVSAGQTVTIGLQSTHPELTHGNADFIDTWLYMYDGPNPYTSNVIWNQDDWQATGWTDVTTPVRAKYTDSLCSSYTFTNAGTYSLVATTWADADYPNINRGPYYMISNVPLTYVDPPNHSNAPVALGIPDAPAQPESFSPAYNYGTSAYFSDPNGDTLTYSLGSITPHGLTLSDLTINATTGVVTFTSLAGSSGYVDVEVRAYDGKIYSPYDTFRFTVNPGAYNHTPQSFGIPDRTVFEDGSPIRINLWDAFRDVEQASSALTYAVQANTNTGLISTNISDPSDFTLTPIHDMNGSADVTVRATDSGGLFKDYKFKITVTPVNDLPVTDSAEVSPGFDGAIYVTGYDADFHDPAKLAAGQVRFDVVTGPSHGSVVASGSIIYDGAGHYTQKYIYTPTPGFYDEDTFTFRLVTPSGSWKAYAGELAIGPAAENYQERDMELMYLNNDAYPDLVTVNATTNGTGAQRNYYYLNNAGTFVNVAANQIGNDNLPSQSLDVGDLNGDGVREIVVLNYGQLDEYHNWTGAAFNNGTTLANSGTAAQGGAIAVGDIDGDGDRDIVMAGNTEGVRIYKNNGAGVFDGGTFVKAATAATTRSVNLADMDGDGDLDIVLGKVTYFPMILENDGYGGFSRSVSVDWDVCPTTYFMDIGDVDGDGDLDMVTGNYGNATNYGRDYYHENLGGMKFKTTSLNAAGDQTGSVRFADIDADGDLDIVTANLAANNKYYLFDKATGQFSAQVNIGASGNYSAGVIGDTDNDGDLDFIAGVQGRNVLYANQGWNDGAGNIATATIYAGIIKNGSFQHAFNHWTLTEAATPATDPAGDVTQNGTFGIVPNGTTITSGSVIHDYLQGNEQFQYWDFPKTIAGGDAETAVHLSNAPHHAWLEQTIKMPTHASVIGIKLQWDMAYWDHFGTFNPGTEHIALYVHDATNTSPNPIWITTAGFTPTISSTLQTYTVNLPLSYMGKDIRIALELTSLSSMVEYAVDDFRIVAVMSGPAPTPSPFGTAPTLASVMGWPGTQSDYRAGGIYIGPPMAAPASMGAEAVSLAYSSFDGMLVTDSASTTVSTTETMGIGSGTASGFDSAAAGAGQSLSTTSTFSVTAGFDIPQAVDVAVPTSTVTSTETAPVLLAPVTTEPAVAGDQAASAVLSHTPSFASLFENVSETSFQSPDSWVGTEQIGADRGLYTERATALSFDMNGLRFTDLFA